MIGFQSGAFQRGAFQQAGVAPPPSPSGGGRFRHFGALPYERVEPPKKKKPARLQKKKQKELEALQAEARELGIRAETVAALANTAELLNAVLDRREILKRIAEQQLDDEEAIALILASLL